MKAIIYAMGQIFNRYQEKIAWDHVIAIADKDARGIKEIGGIPVITPKEIVSLEYDCIAIFSDRWFEEIKSELTGVYFISPECVISWRDLIAEKVDSTSRISRLYRAYIEEWGYRRILDFGMSVLPDCYLTKQEFLSGDGTVLDGILSLSAKYSSCLYDRVYEEVNACTDVAYDAVLVWDKDSMTEAFWSSFHKRARCILCYTPYLLDGELHREKTRVALQQHGTVTCLSVPEGLFWSIDLEPPVACPEDVAIFVVTHKEYNLCHDSLYRPICVGGYKKEGFLTEQTGENIAYLNPRINECTALYWIWKNTSTQYVGLNHYRRYFYKNLIVSRDNYLDSDRICEILKKYDIILPETFPLDDISVLDQIYNTIDRKLCLEGYRILREEISRNQPDYLDAFEDVMNGHNAFLCNMFVTRRSLFNQYCEWLFSFLIDAAAKLEVDSYDCYSQRLMGFFAERMMTVWLRKQRLKIKELPCIMVK